MKTIALGLILTLMIFLTAASFAYGWAVPQP